MSFLLLVNGRRKHQPSELGCSDLLPVDPLTSRADRRSGRNNHDIGTIGVVYPQPDLGHPRRGKQNVAVVVPPSRRSGAVRLHVRGEPRRVSKMGVAVSPTCLAALHPPLLSDVSRQRASSHAGASPAGARSARWPRERERRPRTTHTSRRVNRVGAFSTGRWGRQTPQRTEAVPRTAPEPPSGVLVELADRMRKRPCVKQLRRAEGSVMRSQALADGARANHADLERRRLTVADQVHPDDVDAPAERKSRVVHGKTLGPNGEGVLVPQLWHRSPSAVGGVVLQRTIARQRAGCPSAPTLEAQIPIAGSAIRRWRAVVTWLQGHASCDAFPSAHDGRGRLAQCQASTPTPISSAAPASRLATSPVSRSVTARSAV